MLQTDKDFDCPCCDKKFFWGLDEDSPNVRTKNCGANAYWKLKEHMDDNHPEAYFICDYGGSSAFWKKTGSCSNCGSISPERFFQAIEAGYELGPTDKNYKAYINVENEALGKYWVCGSATYAASGYVQLTEELCEEFALGSYDRQKIGDYVSIEQHKQIDHEKFYFQHLDEAGKTKLVDLVNDKKINFSRPGYFYTLPYFMKVA
jgi:hypothetical protein